VNAAKNYVLDISGTVRISGGDIQINDGGSIVSNNSTLNIANTDVQTIYLGGAATNIVIGSTLGNTTINNNINVGGSSSFTGNIVSTGALLISNTTPSVGSDSGALVISGGAGIGGNLNVGGPSNFANVFINNLTASTNPSSGALIINGGVGIGGNLNIGGSLGFSSDLDLSGNISVNQITLKNGNLLSNTGQLNLSTLTKPSVNKNTGAVIVGGGVGIGGNLNVGGTSNFENVFINKSTVSNNKQSGALIVNGGVGIGGNLNIGGSLGLSSDLILSGDISVKQITLTSGNLLSSTDQLNLSTLTKPSVDNTSGAVIVGGGVGIGGNLNVGGSSNFANVFINNSTASSNPSSGALIVNGGVGIGGDLNIGGSLGLTTDLNLPGNITVKQITITSGNLLSNTGQLNLSTLTKPSVDNTSGAVIVGGGVGIGGNLNVGGFSNLSKDTSIGGNVSIMSQTGSSSITTGALTVGGGVGIGDNLNVGGTVTSNELVLTSGRISSSSNNIDIIGTGGTTTYTIGSNSGDVLIVKGKIIGTLDGGQTIQTTSSNPTFLVNQRAGNAISGYAGLDIYDNSGNVFLSNDDYCKTNKVSGYIHVGTDLQSYVLKAPSFGTNPSNDDTKPIYKISQENRLRIGVNELNLWDISKNVTRGLVIIQPDTDYKNYQISKGHSYGSYNDADYAINVCPDFDISNIMLKNFDSISGTQTIGTNVSVLGNFINGNLFVTKSMSVSGTGLFSGNVGIGTSVPLLGLDVSGSSRFVGPLISTNYDTLRFSNNYGYGWQDKSNTVIDSSYYQDVASSYDGKYQYALVYNKYGVGSVNISSNSGASWSNVPLPSSYAGNIIYQAVPFMNNATGSGTTYSKTFRFQDLAGNISLPNAIPLNIQVGTYIASASSVYDSQIKPSNVFDNDNSTYWRSGLNYSYGYSNSFNTITTNSSTILGDYIQISLPYSFCLQNYQIYPISTSTLNSFGISIQPTKIYVCGSNNSTSWYNLTPLGNVINTSSSSQTSAGNTYVSFSNTRSFNTYRFIVGNVYGTDSSTTSALITRIDLSGIFQNTTGSFSSSIAASGTGQYTTVANQGYYPGTGNLFISSNYGQVGSWTDTNQQATAVWQGISMSQTGQIQAAIGINSSGSGNIYLSTNYGQPGTWNPVLQLLNKSNGWQTISMSSSGQYITAIQASSISSGQKGNIWVSADYGSTWSSNYSIFNYTQTVNSFLNLGTSDFNKTVCVSSSGQYQTALGLAPTSDLTSNANIWRSSDYGLTWSDTGYRAPAISGASSILTSISMTGSGLNQVVSYVGGNTGSSQPSSTVYGNILVSSNYGASWTDTNFKAPTENLNGNTYYGFVSKVQSTVNGQYVLGVSKYADISGNTYNNNNSTVGGVGNIFISSVPTSTNLLINQYLGSPYTNGINQTHGIQLSVPTVNNASIMMGYDINYDSGYINSGDQNGANSLVINTNGGFVGIGKISPNVALDVSGNLVVSGGLTIGGTTNFSANSTFNTIGVTSSTNGALQVVGGVGIGGNLNVGGFSNFVLDSSFNGNLLITSSTDSMDKNSGALQVVGGVGVGGNLNVGGFSNFVLDSSFNGNLLITSSTDSMDKNSGALQVAGGVGVGGNLNVGGFSNFVLDSSFNGNLLITSSTDSTDKNSGALQVVGGVGVGGNLNVGGFSNFVLDSSFNGNLLITSATGSTDKNSGALRVAGGVGVGGNLNVGGFSNFVLDSSFNGNVVVNKNIITIGNIGIRTNNISQYALNVDGSANVTSLYINGTQLNSTAQWSNSGSNIYYTAGSVGIGTNNPTYTLDVSGTIYITQDISYSNYTLISNSKPLIYAMNSATLGYLGGSYIPFFTFRNGGSGTSLNAFQYRFSDGGNQSTRIQHNTTGTNQAYLEFNPPNAWNGIGLYGSSSGTFGTGSGITVNGVGYVGIMTTNPQYVLDVSGSIRVNSGRSTSNKLLVLYDGSSPDLLSTAIDFYGFGINPSILRYQLPSGGTYSHNFYSGSTLLFQIGTYNTTTANPFYITNNTVSTSTSTGALQVSGGAGIGGNLYVGGNSIVLTNTTITTQSFLYFNGTTGGYVSTLNNNLYIVAKVGTIYFQPNGSSTYQGSYSTTGQMTAVSFNASSDYRIKSNIENLPNNFTVDKLRPVQYDMSGGQGHDMGFLAHEVQEIFPFLVTGVKDGEEKQTLNYNGFIALLVKEVQDLKKENIDLKTRLDAIEKRLM